MGSEYDDSDDEEDVCASTEGEEKENTEGKKKGGAVQPRGATTDTVRRNTTLYPLLINGAGRRKDAGSVRLDPSYALLYLC